MTLEELKKIILELPEEYNDYDVVFGSAFCGLSVENIEVDGTTIKLEI